MSTDDQKASECVEAFKPLADAANEVAKKTKLKDEPALPLTLLGNDGYGRLCSREQYYGMSLRDYFAAKSPEIPDWFKTKYWRLHFNPKAIRPKSMDEGLSLQNARLRGAIHEWWKAFNSANSDMPYELKSIGESEAERSYLEKWQAEYEEYSEAVEDDRIANSEALFIAWRWHYADAMLKHRQENPL